MCRSVSDDGCAYNVTSVLTTDVLLCAPVLTTDVLLCVRSVLTTDVLLCVDRR